MNIQVVKVGILGSGFGGMHTALALKKHRARLPDHITIEVDLISRDDYFWLVTMAHEIATGNLMPDDVKQPLRSLSTKVYDNFIQAEVTNIKADTQEVQFSLTNTVSDSVVLDRSRQYDYIVSALGSKACFFNVPGAAEHSLPLKTLADVRQIKNRVMQSFEDAEIVSDAAEIKKLLSFVIVGGGATGVEIAAELADMIRGPLGRRFPKVTDQATVTIINGRDKITIPEHPWMSAAIEATLTTHHGIRVINNSLVSKVDSEGVYIDENLIPTNNVIWTGGVQAAGVVTMADTEPPRTKSGRVKVSRDLSIPGSDHVFIIGDQGSAKNAAGDEYPMRAQFAVRQGALVAKNIVNDLVNQPREKFDYQDKGVIIALGRGQGVAEVFGRQLTGWPAYLLYRIVYIPQLIGFRAKAKTTFEWFLNLFSTRDLSKL